MRLLCILIYINRKSRLFKTWRNEVFGIKRSSIRSKEYWPWIIKHNEKINWQTCNLKKEPENFNFLIKEINPTHIIDFMGQGMVAPSWDDPRLWYKTNLAEKSYVLNSFLKLDWLQRYVRISTPEVFGSNTKFIKETSSFNPSTPYAISHASIDYHLRCLGKQFNLEKVYRVKNFLLNENLD